MFGFRSAGKPEVRLVVGELDSHCVAEERERQLPRGDPLDRVSIVFGRELLVGGHVRVGHGQEGQNVVPLLDEADLIGRVEGVLGRIGSRVPMAGQGQGAAQRTVVGPQNLGQDRRGAGSCGSLSPAGAAAKTHGPHARKKNGERIRVIFLPPAV